MQDDSIDGSVRRLRALYGAHVDGLADVLVDCVEGGASVSFMHPPSRERAHAFCPDCGTPVYACAVVDLPAYSLRIGCLDRRHELRPRAQQWCGSALPWSSDLRDVPRVEPA